jgi:hypothetical protein
MMPPSRDPECGAIPKAAQPLLLIHHRIHHEIFDRTVAA